MSRDIFGEVVFPVVAAVSGQKDYLGALSIQVNVPEPAALVFSTWLVNLQYFQERGARGFLSNSALYRLIFLFS